MAAILPSHCLVIPFFPPDKTAVSYNDYDFIPFKQEYIKRAVGSLVAAHA